jgi:hypothetical protein
MLWLIVLVGLWLRLDFVDVSAVGTDPYCGDDICQADGCPPGGPGTPGDGCEEMAGGNIYCPEDCEVGCNPSWQFEYNPIGGDFNEHCVPIPGEAGLGDAAAESAQNLYWCECTANTYRTVRRYDANECDGPSETFYCDWVQTGYFEDGTNQGEGFCCETQPSACWGDLWCPY